MSFSQDWDDTYRANAHLSIWPWTDVVSMVHHHASPKSGFNRILEIGCGAGANLPFLRSLDGVEAYATDGSPAIIAKLREAFPDMADRLGVADFTQDLGFDGPFDLILDRCALPHNNVSSVRHGIALCADALRPGGRFMAVDWFSTEHEGARHGTLIDSHTREGFPESTALNGIGPIQFFDAPHIENLLVQAGLRLVHLELKTSKSDLPPPGAHRAWWNFVAEKV